MLIECTMCCNESVPAFVHAVADCGRTDMCKVCCKRWFEDNLLMSESTPKCPSCSTPVRYKELRQCGVSDYHLANFVPDQADPPDGPRASVGALGGMLAQIGIAGARPAPSGASGGSERVVACAECTCDVAVYADAGHADGYVRCPELHCGQLTCIEHRRRLVRYTQADAGALGEDVIASVVARAERAPAVGHGGGGLLTEASGATMSRHLLCQECVAVASNPEVSRVRRYIEEEVLNLLCPQCRRPIVFEEDFSDCLALHCDPQGPCKARPCAWCFEDVGLGERTDASNQRAHEHCRTCPHAPEPEREFTPGDGVRGGGLYCRAVEHEAPHVKRYLDEHWRGKKRVRALAVLDELGANERARVIEKLRAQLDELGITE